MNNKKIFNKYKAIILVIKIYRVYLGTNIDRVNSSTPLKLNLRMSGVCVLKHKPNVILNKLFTNLIPY